MKLYIIAHTWRDVDLTIHHFFTPHKAVKMLSELVGDEYGKKANDDDDPKEYIDGYWNWVREENDNMCDNVVILEIVDLDEKPKYEFGCDSIENMDRKEEICKCNMCGQFYYDELSDMMDSTRLQLIDQGEGQHKGCGNCGTDGYLMDIEPVTENRFSMIAKVNLYDKGGNLQEMAIFWDDKTNSPFGLDSSFIEQCEHFYHPYTEEEICFDDYPKVF